MDLNSLSKVFSLITQACALGVDEAEVIRIHQIQIVLFGGIKGTVTYRQIENEFSLSNAAVRRSISSLSAFSRHRVTHGYGLVEKFIDPDEGRRYRVKLAPKGLMLFEFLKAV